MHTALPRQHLPSSLPHPLPLPPCLPMQWDPAGEQLAVLPSGSPVIYIWSLATKDYITIELDLKVRTARARVCAGEAAHARMAVHGIGGHAAMSKLQRRAGRLAPVGRWCKGLAARGSPPPTSGAGGWMQPHSVSGAPSKRARHGHASRACEAAGGRPQPGGRASHALAPFARRCTHAP